MGKRLTDTEKWKKPFIKGLPAEYKLFWFYLLDDCDFAGIWQVDMEVAQMRLGIKLSLERAQGLFIGKVVAFDNGTKLFIPDFIDFQYGTLTPKNKMYNSVVGQIEKYKLIPHLSSINGGMVKDKVIVKVISNNPLSNIPGANEIFIAEISELREAYLLPQNKMVFEQVAMNYYLQPGKVTLWLNEFCRKVIADGDNVKTMQDFTRHFNRWLAKQKDIQNPPTGEQPSKAMVF